MTTGEAPDIPAESSWQQFLHLTFGYTPANPSISIMKHAPLLFLCMCTACAATSDLSPSDIPSPSEHALALRYTLDVWESYPDVSLQNITELHLPAQGVTCNVGSTGSGIAGNEKRYPARAFFSTIRNESRSDLFRSPEQSAIKPIRIPAELAARIVELAELTRCQNTLAAELGRELMQVTPLNTSFEYRKLIEEATSPNILPAHKTDAQRIIDHADQLLWDRPARDKAQRLRDLRTQLETMRGSPP